MSRPGNRYRGGGIVVAAGESFRGEGIVIAAADGVGAGWGWRGSGLARGGG